MAMHVVIPAALAEVSQGRDLINTAEFAKATSRASQTVRKNYCISGNCFGIRPIKIGNRLLWRVSDVARLLSGDAQK